jgi:hypothetical protein
MMLSSSAIKKYIVSFRWFIIGPNFQHPNTPSGKCPNGRCPKDVARTKIEEMEFAKFYKEYARNYTIITFQEDTFLLATYSPARHAHSVALQTDSSSLVIEKLDVRYEFVFDEILGLA